MATKEKPAAKKRPAAKKKPAAKVPGQIVSKDGKTVPCAVNETDQTE